MNPSPLFAHVGIVGAGAMGRGIAQIAAQAGSQVWLFDAQPGAAEAAQSAIAQQWQRLAEKGRLDAVAAVQGTGALLFINDHWQEAIAAEAYGAHLGQEDLDALQPDEVNTLRESGLRLGVSTHGYAEMVRADAVSPSYIAMGAVFPTTLKRMATAPQGVARLATYAKLMSHYPLVGIGGIGAEHFADVAATGVGSIAVVRALVNAPDPEAAARELMQAMG